MTSYISLSLREIKAQIGEKKDFEHICRTGFGKYKVRGIVEVGEEKGYPMVYVKSLPDNVNSTVVVEKLNAMYANKELPMIQDISDATAGTDTTAGAGDATATTDATNGSVNE